MIRQQTVNEYGESVYTPIQNLNPSYNSLGGGGGYKPAELEPPTTYIGSSPFGNVKVYDLDAEIEPIQRVQIAPNVPNLANMDTYYKTLPKNVAISESQELTLPTSSNVQNASSTATSTIAPISTAKKPNYLLYGVGALVLYFVAYKVLKKK
jgi:hypothetical protein